MTEPTVLKFIDPHEGSAAAIVRTDQEKRAVGITLSIQSDGDIEAFMPIADAARFADAILQAIARVKNWEEVEP